MTVPEVFFLTNFFEFFYTSENISETHEETDLNTFFMFDGYLISQQGAFEVEL